MRNVNTKLNYVDMGDLHIILDILGKYKLPILTIINYFCTRQGVI